MSFDAPLFFSTFAVIFIAELPDKTALATLLLATRNKPLGVFIGVALAFVVQSAVAILFGGLFRLVPHHYVQFFAGILFLIFSYLMWRESRGDGQGEGETEAVTLARGNDKKPVINISIFKVILSSFTVIFIAEWGDLTQLATMALVARYENPFTIFISAVLALWAVTAIAVFAGRALAEKINPQLLQKTAAVVFAGVGVVMLYGALKS